ncbi:MAG TPA: hypothetical protein VFH08_07345 [Chitinophagaceae bacterium]|nr:hypothetical protein [Chitinophagaceae bacterium]
MNWLFRRKNGFRIRSYGRAGKIIFVDKEKVCEMEFEISGVPQFTILIYFDALQYWTKPEGVLISNEQKHEIRSKLIDWLAKKKLKAQL